MPIRVTIWNEFRHEKKKESVAALYPNGIHAYIRDFLQCDEVSVTLAALDDPECGLPDEVLNNTDVLMWWGHVAHNEVPFSLVDKIERRVRNGMGIVFLHSAHKSRPFQRIVGCTGNLLWGKTQRAIVWNLAPTHPITKGVPAHFELQEEMYGEPFFIPKPEEVIFGTWFEQGNLFRGGVTFLRGLGRIFYFHPGHESCTSFYNENVQTVIKNAVRWCAPTVLAEGFDNEKCFEQKQPVFESDKS